MTNAIQCIYRIVSGHHHTAYVGQEGAGSKKTIESPAMFTGVVVAGGTSESCTMLLAWKPPLFNSISVININKWPSTHDTGTCIMYVCMYDHVCILCMCVRMQACMHAH